VARLELPCEIGVVIQPPEARRRQQQVRHAAVAQRVELRGGGRAVGRRKARVAAAGVLRKVRRTPAAQFE
jgi:hypothetical protein